MSASRDNGSRDAHRCTWAAGRSVWLPISRTVSRWCLDLGLLAQIKAICEDGLYKWGTESAHHGFYRRDWWRNWGDNSKSPNCPVFIVRSGFMDWFEQLTQTPSFRCFFCNGKSVFMSFNIKRLLLYSRFWDTLKLILISALQTANN